MLRITRRAALAAALATPAFGARAQIFTRPVRIIVPGRVYRRDNLDLTHTPMFQ